MFTIISHGWFGFLNGKLWLWCFQNTDLFEYPNIDSTSEVSLGAGLSVWLTNHRHGECFGENQSLFWQLHVVMSRDYTLQLLKSLCKRLCSSESSQFLISCLKKNKTEVNFLFLGVVYRTLSRFILVILPTWDCFSYIWFPGTLQMSTNEVQS